MAGRRNWSVEYVFDSPEARIAMEASVSFVKRVLRRLRFAVLVLGLVVVTLRLVVRILELLVELVVVTLDLIDVIQQLSH
jgi:hypothetical protein